MDEVTHAPKRPEIIMIIMINFIGILKLSPQTGQGQNGSQHGYHRDSHSNVAND